MTWANAATRPSCQDRASHWAEVRVGTETSPLGFVYVGVFPPAQAPPFVTRPYARYDPTTDRVYAERYALAFDAPLPTHFAPVERLGDFGTNTIAGIKAAADVRLLGGLLSFQRTHADLRSDPAQLPAWSGPGDPPGALPGAAAVWPAHLGQGQPHLLP